MEDKQIVELFLEKNERTISESEKKYGRFCGSIASNILGDKEDVKEVLNDTFLGAWNSIPPNIPEKLASFLGKITRNLCLNRVRSRNTAKRGKSEADIIFDEVSDFICSGNDMENEIEAKELSSFITEFLFSVSETERNIFVCRYWYFDSIDVIAKTYGFSKSKVKSMLFRIRKKLHNELKKENLL